MEDSRGAAVLSTGKGDFTFDAVLYAVGRRLILTGSGEATDELTDSRAIKTDRFTPRHVPGCLPLGCQWGSTVVHIP